MFSDKHSYNNLKKHLKKLPETLVILGSGWNKVLDSVKKEQNISYKNIFGISASVPGHERSLIVGSINNKRVAFMSGRFHTYEGYSGKEATTPIRIFAKAGVKNIIVTSAVGGLNENYRVGDFVILKDLITLFQVMDNPLVGPKFIDMSKIFSEELRKVAIKNAKELKIKYQEGIHVFFHGPNYESPADKQALKLLGADVFGMSMTPEVIMAKSLGLNILGLAFVTNLAFVKHDHKEVLSESEKAGDKMKKLIIGIIENIV